MKTPVPQNKWINLTAGLVAAVLVGCAHTTSGNPHPGSTNPAPPVNTVQLNPGSYPTTAAPPLGDAGSDQVGRRIEGQRLAAHVIGPWQVDPSLSAAPSTSVVNGFNDLGHVVWPPIIAGADGMPFVVGFMSERKAPGANPPMSLRNAILLFANPDVANTVAHNMTEAAMHMPRDLTVTPVVTQPERALPIPGHPDSRATLLNFQEGNQPIQEITVLTAHGPYVVVQVVRCAAGPDCEASLAARTLDLQLPLIDTFTPTDPRQFPTLPQDPTGLVVKTLPLPPGQATTTSGAAYPPAGALHLDEDPTHTGPALTAAGVDYVSVNLDTLYQAKDPNSAQTLASTLADAAAAAPGAQGAAPAPGMPQSRCTRVSDSSGLVSRYWCLASAGRYAIKAIARQLDNAHQQVSAQFRILGG